LWYSKYSTPTSNVNPACSSGIWIVYGCLEDENAILPSLVISLLKLLNPEVNNLTPICTLQLICREHKQLVNVQATEKTVLH
jgi:hypothetical protein